MGLIYKVTNTENEKVYIGLTTRDFETRKKEHLYNKFNTNQSSALHKAMIKYGHNKFKWEVLEDNIEDDMLDEKEIYYIQKFNSLIPNGYNTTIGGRIEGVRRLGKGNAKSVLQIDKDTYEILSIEKSLTDMAVKLNTSPIRISDVCHRKAFTAKGYIFRFANDYDINEIAEHQSKRKITGKPIVCYFSGTPNVYNEFRSIYECSKKTGVDERIITECCNLKRHIFQIPDVGSVYCRYKRKEDRPKIQKPIKNTRAEEVIDAQKNRLLEKFKNYSN